MLKYIYYNVNYIIAMAIINIDYYCCKMSSNFIGS